MPAFMADSGTQLSTQASHFGDTSQLRIMCCNHIFYIFKIAKKIWYKEMLEAPVEEGAS